MTIKKAKLKNNLEGNKTECVLITFENNPKIWSVPLDPGNRHYSEYLEWVEAGNTPEAAD